ncbi:hypothetical protein BC829DRAFT_440525 [Chytridium lagenaria]|nr:hypothetical protein BC829DRAFT_440525 [Chytridium lagenaria]
MTSSQRTSTTAKPGRVTFAPDVLVHNPYIDSFPNSRMSPYGPSIPDERRRLVPTPMQPSSSQGIGISGLNITTTGLRNRSHAPKLAHRTTKKTEKLVLLPGGAVVADIAEPNQDIPYIPDLIHPHDPNLESQQYHNHHHHHNSSHPWYYDDPAPKPGAPSRTTAEMTSKERRVDLPRVTCYCTAETYRLEEVTTYVASMAGSGGGVTASLFDECLYISHESDAAVWEVLGTGMGVRTQGFNADYGEPGKNSSPYPLQSPRSPGLEAVYGDTVFSFSPTRSETLGGVTETVSFSDAHDVREITEFRDDSLENAGDVQPRWMHRKEMFMFDFGVVADFEIEDFHFQYDLRVHTNHSGNPMIKLTISHAMAQSAKLALFENVMNRRLRRILHCPR